MNYIAKPKIEDAPELYRIIKSWPDYWEYDLKKISYPEFFNFCKSVLEKSLIAINDRKIIGWGSLDYISPDEWATINIVVGKKVVTSKHLRTLCREGLKIFFNEYNLQVIRGFTRAENKLPLSLLEDLGFTIEGTLRKYKKINGKWHDYIVSSILKEEL